MCFSPVHLRAYSNPTETQECTQITRGHAEVRGEKRLFWHTLPWMKMVGKEIREGVLQTIITLQIIICRRLASCRHLLRLLSFDGVVLRFFSSHQCNRNQTNGSSILNWNGRWWKLNTNVLSISHRTDSRASGWTPWTAVTIFWWSGSTIFFQVVSAAEIRQMAAAFLMGTEGDGNGTQTSYRYLTQQIAELQDERPYVTTMIWWLGSLILVMKVLQKTLHRVLCPWCDMIASSDEIAQKNISGTGVRIP